MKSKSINPEFNSLSLKWKNWRWFLLISFNVSVLALLAFFKILLNKGVIENDKGKLSFVAVLAPLSITLLCAYIVASIKFKKDYSALIKEQRFKYFIRGSLSSCLSSCWLLIGLVALMSDKDHNLIFYSCVSLSCITGLVSGGFITFYEFCINWDIFYSKNKETIVKEYLQRQNKLKIKEDIQEDEG